MLVYLLQIPFRKIENIFIKVILFLIKMAATLFLGLALIAFDYKIIWNHEYAFAALHLALLPDIFADLFLFLFSLFGKGSEKRSVKIVLTALLCVVFTTYNIINMQTI